MNRKLCMALLCLILTHCCRAQQFYFPQQNLKDSTAMGRQIPALATQVLSQYKNPGDQQPYLDDLFRMQILAGKYTEAKATIALLRSRAAVNGRENANLLYKEHELFLEAKLEGATTNTFFKTAFVQLAGNFFKGLNDKEAYRVYNNFITSGGMDGLKNDFGNSLSEVRKKDSVDVTDAITLCRNYYILQLYQNIEAVSRVLIKEDCNRRYIIEKHLVKTGDGASIAAITVLKRGIITPRPAVLQYTIYADSADWTRIVEPAAYGYAGVIAYTRGKAFSPDKIVPYEHDGEDANAVIDWISKQNWCNGKIGMYGGSYNGFTQWAAAKYHHTALKTIVPYVAAMPGLGLPMENNVFINANYGWIFYVSDNKYLDNKTYYDPKRWRAINNNWYASGAAYRKIDSIDGTPNPFLQMEMKHPDYDKYWQQQVPYKTDFANINIPVLTFEGYYDDGQISGLHYYAEHLKYNPKANHYLIIGPYDHFGTQHGGDAVLRDYRVDRVALISTRDITFQWLDHILKGAEMPAIIKDKVNYEVMGANVWKHAPSIAKMSNKTLKLYLTNVKDGNNYKLLEKRPDKPGSLGQQVDLADHKTSDGDYYPYPIIKDLDRSNGLYFISKPFDKPVEVNGMFKGLLKATINKKDMDFYVVLYELTPEGKYFELSYFLGRASYTADMAKRVLLHPGKMEPIPFYRSRLVSRQLSKGSRLLVVLNIDKNSFAQVNYGTGKDVSDETAKDGKVPLKIKWHTDSYINVPVME